TARHDLFSDRVGDLLVRVELHRVDGATLGLGTQVGGVPEHLGDRHLSPHDLRVPPLRHAFDLTPAGIQVADHIAHVLLWGRDLDVGHGLEQLDTGTLGGLLDSHGAGDAEGHLGGVDVVVRAVDEDGPDIDERVSGEDPVLEGVGDAGVDRGNVLLGDASAGDLVDELVTAAGAGRLEVDDHMAVLA